MEYSINEIDKIAKEIAESYIDYKIFVTNGEMGAGKTTFFKSFCKFLQVEEEVNSPTFAIANVYQSKLYGEVNHFDFYRLETSSDALEIGVEEYLYSGNYCLIEWADIVIDHIPKPYVEVNIQHGNSNDTRIINTRIVE